MTIKIFTHSLTRPTLASTFFWAKSPRCNVALVVGKNSWCDAAGVFGGIIILFSNNVCINCNLCWNCCWAMFAAWFNCCGVNGGIMTGGGGGVTRTPLFTLLKLAETYYRNRCKYEK